METFNKETSNENLTPSPALGFDVEPAEEEGQPTAKLPKTKTPFPNKIKILLIGLLMIIFVVAVLITLFSPKPEKETPSALNWTPEPLPEFSQQPTKKPSSIASDSAFLKLEEDLNSLDKDITSADLSEAKLSFPVIETKINMAQ
jgi:hypothetical protein